jgi:hypothetical protein
MAKKSKADTETKKREDDLNRWKARLEVAIAYQKKHGDQPTGTSSRWTANIKAMAGDFNSKEEIGEDALDVNITFSTQETFLSPLWINDPYIVIRPTCAQGERSDGSKYDNVKRAKITEIELNYWMRELGARHIMRKMILSADATNCGYCLTGYITKKNQVQNDDGDFTEAIPTIRYRKPFLRFIGPRNVLVPPGKEDLEGCEWFAIKWCLPLQDVKDRWPGTTEDLKADLAIHDDRKAGGSANLAEWLQTDDAKLVDIYEIWDKRKRRVLHIVQGHPKELNGGDGETWPYDLEGFPTIRLAPVEITEEYYGTPRMSFSLPQQKELNAARTATMRRENQVKENVFVNGDVSEDQMNVYKNAPDGAMVKMDLGEGGFKENFLTVQSLNPRLSGYQAGEVAKGDYFLTTGLGYQSRGSGDPNVESATASANVEKWQIVRQTNLGDRVRTAYLEMAKKLWMILKQFPDEKRDRMIGGSYGEPVQQVRYTLEELHGEFAWSMDLSSMLADDPQTRVANALGLYNLLRQDPKVKPEALIYDVLTAMGKHNVESYLMTLRTPDQEWQEMLQGLPVEPKEQDDHASHLANHEVRAAQAEAMLDQMAQQGLDLDPMFDKLRFALGLLVAHVNATMRLLQMVSGPNESAGSPVAENSLRSSQKAASGAETQAEMKGQAMKPAGGKSPAGVPMRR